MESSDFCGHFKMLAELVHNEFRNKSNRDGRDIDDRISGDGDLTKVEEEDVTPRKTFRNILCDDN